MNPATCVDTDKTGFKKTGSLSLSGHKTAKHKRASLRVGPTKKLDHRKLLLKKGLLP